MNRNVWRALPWLIVCAAASAQGQVEPRSGLFSGSPGQEKAAHGGNASLAFRLRVLFSLIADFSARQESEPGVSADIPYGLFGGRLWASEHRGVQPFTRVTGGVGRWKSAS